MAATSRNDASWLQTGWEQNKGRSSQMRHYRAPAPRQKGASRNSLLQCNKMSVKTKQVDDRARQIRFKYGKNNLERELNKKNGTDLTPFVTKVQIRKIQERSAGFNSAGRTSPRRRNESEKVHTSLIKNSEENGKMIDSAILGDNNDEESYSSLETVDEKDETYEESMLREDIIAIQVNEKNQTDNYLYPETSENQLENVQHLIKYLTRRLRDPFEASRKQIPSPRPIAAYARPTKGEIALSVKGPVLLAPVTKVAMTTSRSHSPDKPSRLEARSLPEFADSRAFRARARPISSVSDSVVVTGRKMHGPARVTWAGREHAQNGVFDQKYNLCSSCKSHYGSDSVTKMTHERAKSAVSGDDWQRKCHGCLPQLIRQTPTKLYSRNEGNRSTSPKRRQHSHKGMVSPFELQVYLAELNSYDYGSPGPPPSLSNSDDESAS
ncbi:uncharacterized protein LOC110054859 [Orbicella faveolata]|uniref:uncharacterized protein LOC110054859 n=1 Tax=Orbicella faveolata TaxID=48498 RepID=UPI0009E4D10F|nr:uncharacterized protein LOC110054859 [Orbicella faveolata]XP_020616885.1 uncharacterized protein LOC110054859 [Orbicella faveolata]XP_020616886.1 uncharacterized protein LOC110054859 [Orbicella faveolata]XP_020616887.1 uncharacterized protein LOC110054859 [Orbicella faveolata]